MLTLCQTRVLLKLKMNIRLHSSSMVYKGCEYALQVKATCFVGELSDLFDESISFIGTAMASATASPEWEGMHCR